MLEDRNTVDPKGMVVIQKLNKFIEDFKSLQTQMDDAILQKNGEIEQIKGEIQSRNKNIDLFVSSLNQNKPNDELILKNNFSSENYQQNTITMVQNYNKYYKGAISLISNLMSMMTIECEKDDDWSCIEKRLNETNRKVKKIKKLVDFDVIQQEEPKSSWRLFGGVVKAVEYTASFVTGKKEKSQKNLFDEIIKTIETKNNTIKNLNEQFKASSSSVDTLSSKIKNTEENMKSEIEDLKRDVNKRTTDNESLQQQIADHLKSIETYEEQIKQSDLSIKDMKSEIEALQKNILEQTKKNESYEITIGQQTESINSINALNEQFGNKITELNSSISGLKQKVKELEGKLQAEKSNNDSNTSKINLMQSIIDRTEYVLSNASIITDNELDKYKVVNDAISLINKYNSLQQSNSLNGEQKDKNTKIIDRVNTLIFGSGQNSNNLLENVKSLDFTQKTLTIKQIVEKYKSLNEKINRFNTLKTDVSNKYYDNINNIESKINNVFDVIDKEQLNAYSPKSTYTYSKKIDFIEQYIKSVESIYTKKAQLLLGLGERKETFDSVFTRANTIFKTVYNQKDEKKDVQKGALISIIRSLFSSEDIQQMIETFGGEDYKQAKANKKSPFQYVTESNKSIFSFVEIMYKEYQKIVSKVEQATQQNATLSKKKQKLLEEAQTDKKTIGDLNDTISSLETKSKTLSTQNEILCGFISTIFSSIGLNYSDCKNVTTKYITGEFVKLRQIASDLSITIGAIKSKTIFSQIQSKIKLLKQSEASKKSEIESLQSQMSILNQKNTSKQSEAALQLQKDIDQLNFEKGQLKSQFEEQVEELKSQKSSVENELSTLKQNTDALCTAIWGRKYKTNDQVLVKSLDFLNKNIKIQEVIEKYRLLVDSLFETGYYGSKTYYSSVEDIQASTNKIFEKVDVEWLKSQSIEPKQYEKNKQKMSLAYQYFDSEHYKIVVLKNVFSDMSSDTQIEEVSSYDAMLKNLFDYYAVFAEVKNRKRVLDPLKQLMDSLGVINMMTNFSDDFD